MLGFIVLYKTGSPINPFVNAKLLVRIVPDAKLLILVVDKEKSLFP